jgi:hypothetical protein
VYFIPEILILKTWGWDQNSYADSDFSLNFFRAWGVVRRRKKFRLEIWGQDQMALLDNISEIPNPFDDWKNMQYFRSYGRFSKKWQNPRFEMVAARAS